MPSAMRLACSSATRLQPGGFALVGMGTFCGGLAHAPLSAPVLVAELAGSYDLLLPLVLAFGVGLGRVHVHGAHFNRVQRRREYAQVD
jgi:CIC family chloride channel protein